jgi:hypothetical protein
MIWELRPVAVAGPGIQDCDIERDCREERCEFGGRCDSLDWFGVHGWQAHKGGRVVLNEITDPSP